jgi:hypothetical protein
MRVLFMMTESRTMKYYHETLRFMLEGGHAVHVAYFSLEKHRKGTLHDELEKEFPSRFHHEIVPGKPPGLWRDLGTALAWAGDYLFFLQPFFKDTPRLRERVEVRISRPFVWLMNHCPGFRSPTGRAVVRKCILAAERAIPAAWTFKRYIRRINPDVLLVSPLLSHSGMQWEYLRAAKAMRVPTGYCVASWDNLTTKGALRGEPNYTVVWNGIQKREAVELHGISPDRIIVTGAQYFDDWFVRRPSRSREDFCQEVGLSPDHPFILYMCSSNFMAPRERDFVAKWIGALRRSGIAELVRAGVLIRPYPEYAEQWRGAGLMAGDSVAVWPPGGEYAITEEAKRNFYDSVYHSLAVVGVNTTAMIESAIIGKCVLSVSAEEFAESQNGTIHFNYMKQENGGFLFLARDMQEHLSHLQVILNGKESLRQQILRFVQSFARPMGLDRPCIPELARIIERMAVQETEKCTVSALTLLLRFGLYPLAVAIRAFRPLTYFKKRKSKQRRKAALRDAALRGSDPLESLRAARGPGPGGQ